MRTKEDVINSFMRDTEAKVNSVYRQGYGAGYKACEAEKKEVADNAYNRGLEDAWECARRMTERKDGESSICWKLCGIMNIDLFKKISVYDAMKALEEYDKKQAEEIHVGDVVKDPSGLKAVVTNTDTHYHLYYPANGKTWKAPKTTKLTKTGTYITGTYITEAEFHHE